MVFFGGTLDNCTSFLESPYKIRTVKCVKQQQSGEDNWDYRYCTNPLQTFGDVSLSKTWLWTEQQQQQKQQQQQQQKQC